MSTLWVRAGNVRVRTTVAAVAIVGFTLLAGSVALIVFLRSTLTQEVQTTAFLRATDLAAALQAGASEDRLAVGDPEEVVVQVLDESGMVVASSPNYAGRALPPLRPGESTVAMLPIDEHPFLVVATGSAGPEGELIVLFAQTLEAVEESTQAVTGLLVSGLPLILIVMALTTWKVVGRALAPVEAIRREVEEISASELHRRVPAPEGGDEISRLAATMNRMLERLHQAQLRQRRFISDASHELRSPVAAIRQHAEVALAHPDRVNVVDLAETVLAEDLRVQRLVADMLLLARADERSFLENGRFVDLDDLLLDEASKLRQTTDLEIDTRRISAGRVEGDANALRRLVRNLTENAARHATARIVLTLQEEDQLVVLGVEDDGPGIPREARATVLERFVRLDDARTRDSGGTGLGLAIVAEVATAHGGVVEVLESSLGGARLEVRLPRPDDPNA